MSKLKMFLGMGIVALFLVSCEKDVLTENTGEVELRKGDDEISNADDDDRSDKVVFLEDLADAEGVWEVISENTIESERLLYPAGAGLPAVKFISISNETIQLIANDGLEVLNAYPIDNMRFGSVTVGGYFEVDLGNASSRIVILLVGEEMQLSQPFGRNRVKYILKKV